MFLTRCEKAGRTQQIKDKTPVVTRSHILKHSLEQWSLTWQSVSRLHHPSTSWLWTMESDHAIVKVLKHIQHVFCTVCRNIRRQHLFCPTAMFFGIKNAAEFLLLSDVEVQHQLSPVCLETSIFCARSDVFLSALGRENMSRLSAVALDNL